MTVDKHDQAEEFACEAADALVSGNKRKAVDLLARAMKIDCLNSYANILFSGLLPASDPGRLQHARAALEGAARFLGHDAINRPDQRHVIGHVDRALRDESARNDGQASRERNSERHYKGGTDRAAIRMFERDSPFHDQWHELPMRDYLRALFALAAELAETDRPAEAAIHLRELLAMSPVDRLGGAPWLVSVLIRIGLLAEAERWIEIYEQHRSCNGSTFWTSFARGLLMAARGEGDDAIDVLRAASRVNVRENVFNLLVTGERPPVDNTMELPDEAIEPVNLLRAFHPTISTSPFLQEALKRASKPARPRRPSAS